VINRPHISRWHVMGRIDVVADKDKRCDAATKRLWECGSHWVRKVQACIFDEAEYRTAPLTYERMDVTSFKLSRLFFLVR
jgi:hypothetical protein